MDRLEVHEHSSLRQQQTQQLVQQSLSSALGASGSCGDSGQDHWGMHGSPLRNLSVPAAAS